MFRTPPDRFDRTEREAKQFRQLQLRLEAIPDTPIDRLALPVFTTDKDFVRYAKLLSIRLYPHPRR